MPQEGLIPKAKQKPSRLIAILFYSSLITLLVTGGVYLLLQFYNLSLAKQIQAKKTALSKIVTPQDRNLGKELAKIQPQVKSFEEALKKHKFTSYFFSDLEAVTHPEVIFKSLKIDSGSGEVTLVGHTENFVILGQQILAMRKSPFIKKTNIENVDLGKKGGIDFTLKLSVDPSVFLFE